MEKEKLTPEQTTLLMEYMLNNEAKKTLHIGEVPFTLLTLSVAQQISVQDGMKDFEGTKLGWAQEYSLRMLAEGLESFNNEEFEDGVAAYKYLLPKGNNLIEVLSKQQLEFEKEIKSLLEQADDFTDSPLLPED